MNVKEMSFRELKDLEVGAKLVIVENGVFPIQGIVLRGPVSLCAYIGFPKWHPLAKLNYDDVPIDVHGGLTYSRDGNGTYLPEEKHWIGWDYAHSGDLCFYDLDRGGTLRDWEKERLYPEVESDLKLALGEFLWLFLFGWIGVLIRLKIRQATYR